MESNTYKTIHINYPKVGLKKFSRTYNACVGKFYYGLTNPIPHIQLAILLEKKTIIKSFIPYPISRYYGRMLPSTLHLNPDITRNILPYSRTLHINPRITPYTAWRKLNAVSYY